MALKITPQTQYLPTHDAGSGNQSSRARDLWGRRGPQGDIEGSGTNVCIMPPGKLQGDGADEDMDSQIEELMFALDGLNEPGVQADAAFALAAHAKSSSEPDEDAMAQGWRVAIGAKGTIRPLVRLLSTSQEARVREGVVRALINLLCDSETNSHKLLTAGTGGIVEALGTGPRDLRRLACSLVTLIVTEPSGEGKRDVVREHGVELTSCELLEDPSPVPQLKALCALSFGDVEISLAISNAALIRCAVFVAWAAQISHPVRAPCD